MSVPEFARPTRRAFLATALGAGGAILLPNAIHAAEQPLPPHIAITLDLEMSRDYPRRGMHEWDYRKGDLDEATKKYAVEAARIVAEYGGRIHFFCVGRVLEQPDVDWLRDLAQAGHAIGNHTYDHVNVMATEAAETQFRFRRAPWLVEGKSAREVIEENIRLTRIGLRERAGVTEQGFRTPGGFHDGLAQREDLQAMFLGLGYRWVSSKYPRHDSGTPKQEPGAAVFADIVRAQQEAQPFAYPSGLIEIPMSPISDVTAFRSHFWRRDCFLRAVRDAVAWAIATGGVFDFLAHPSCLVVEDPGFETIRLICELVREAGDRARLVDLQTIAEARFPA